MADGSMVSMPRSRNRTDYVAALIAIFFRKICGCEKLFEIPISEIMLLEQTIESFSGAETHM